MPKNPEQTFSGDSDADIIDMEQNPKTGEWESKNPEQNLPEPEPVDKEAVEKEATKRDKRRAKESESVLDEELKSGETMEAKAEKTRIEEKSDEVGKGRPERALEIRKEIEEELRKNPVRLTSGESARIFEEAEKKQAEKILSELTDKGKDMYPDRSTVIAAREKMLQKMVDNEVVSESEKQSFCSDGAFYGFLGKGYDAGGIRLANWKEVIKEALWGKPVIQQIDFFRNMGEGELLAAPRINGRKKLISFEDFKREAADLDLEFQLNVEGAGRQEKLRVLVEREETEIQKRVIERLEKEDQLPGQALKEQTATKEKIEAAEKERIEKAENMPEDEKQEKIRQAAILWEKAFKIDKALRRENFDNFKYKKIKKGGEEDIFKGEQAKRQAKRDKNAMSKELVVLVQEISGRDFMADARQIKNKWPKKELERYITEQVMAALEGKAINGKPIKFIKEQPAEKNDASFEKIITELNNPEIEELIRNIREKAKKVPTIRALEKSLGEGAAIGFHGPKIAEQLNALMEKLPSEELRKRVAALLKQEKREEKNKKNNKKRNKKS